MKHLGRLALALATILYVSSAHAQSTKEAPAGSGQRYQGVLLIDPTTGQPYAAGSGGGGGSAADQTGTNASDGQATSTANQHALAFSYIFNGTTYDRLRGTGGAANVNAIPAPGTCTDTPRTLSAGTSTTLLSAGTYKSVSYMDIGTNPMTFVEGTAAAVVGNGMALNGATAAGMSGGSYTYSVPPSNAVQAISTAGTTAIVKVCN